MSVPSTVMSLVEGGTFEVMTILAGLFSINELSTHTVLNNMSMLIYMSWVGISVASTVLIGRDLDDNNLIIKMLLQKNQIRSKL